MALFIITYVHEEWISSAVYIVDIETPVALPFLMLRCVFYANVHTVICLQLIEVFLYIILYLHIASAIETATNWCGISAKWQGKRVAGTIYKYRGK